MYTLLRAAGSRFLQPPAVPTNTHLDPPANGPNCLYLHFDIRLRFYSQTSKFQFLVYQSSFYPHISIHQPTKTDCFTFVNFFIYIFCFFSIPQQIFDFFLFYQGSFQHKYQSNALYGAAVKLDQKWPTLTNNFSMDFDHRVPKFGIQLPQLPNYPNKYKY